MSQLNNPLEIYKLLPKTNCKKCQARTCLAFADAVIKGEKSLDECSHLENVVAKQPDVQVVKRVPSEQQLNQLMAYLRSEIRKIDFYSSAERLGATLSDGKLKIKCLGKNFIVDSNGNVTSDCHVIPWVILPLLDYVISCSGKNVTGQWVPFRELRNGMTWIPLFGQCEKSLEKIANTHTDLFEIILDVFGGKLATVSYATDISLVLYPLPKVPILICYCRPEEELESKLNIFFDSTAEDNLNIRSIYGVTSAIVRMFEKIALRHG